MNRLSLYQRNNDHDRKKTRDTGDTSVNNLYWRHVNGLQTASLNSGEMKTTLVAAALSAHVGIQIKSEDDAKRFAQLNPGQVALVELNIPTLFTHTRTIVQMHDCYTVRVLGQDHGESRVSATQTVMDIKRFLAGRVGIHSESQILLYGGRQLNNHQSLPQQRVPKGSSLSLVWGLRGAGPEPAHYIKDSDLDPQFDCDFTHVNDDGIRFERGGYEYKRPCGWDRCALKVLGKFLPNDTWLGKMEIRTVSSFGEWAVSYHGNIGPIADEGLDTNKSMRERFGPGIYSTPSIEVASRYAGVFIYEGKMFKVVLQNRVNLCSSDVIPTENTGIGAAYFVTPDDNNIRSYGVCLKEQ